MRRLVPALLVLAALLGPGFVAPASAQGTPSERSEQESAGLDDIEALVSEIEARLETMTDDAVEQSETLDFLSEQVDRAAESLSTSRDRNADLRRENADLASERQALAITQEDLNARLARAQREQQGIMAALREQASKAAAERDELTVRLAALAAERGALEDRLRTSLRTQESLAARLAILTGERDRLAESLAAAESERAELAAKLASTDRTLAREMEVAAAQLERISKLERSQSALSDELSEAQIAAAAAAKELAEQAAAIKVNRETIDRQLIEIEALKKIRKRLELQVSALQDRLEEAAKSFEAEKLARTAAEGRVAAQSKLTEDAQFKVDLLNRQIAALRRQLARINVTLEATEERNRIQKVQIADLGKRLNIALATKVQELSRYRSEFFGRLREVLGERRDITIVGDRFVFQSEVLFDSGSAELGASGQVQLGQLAETLKEIAGRIPEHLNWVLRVDGHTDRQPIQTALFPSNWELSTARAIAVVRFLIDQGIPADHLAATGFGEFQPLDNGEDDVAFRRNRRIELKLTQR